MKLHAIAVLVAVAPAFAAIESLCPKCGRKAPAFLAGQQCYHCGAALPAAGAKPAAAGLPLADPPIWYHARLPSGTFTVRPPASHEKVEREVQVVADGLAPAFTARAGNASAIPLPNGPYSAIAVTVAHAGAESSPGLVYVEAKLTDGTWWGRVVRASPGAGTTLRALWPPAPFSELRLSGLDGTGAFGQGGAVINAVQVQP